MSKTPHQAILVRLDVHHPLALQYLRALLLRDTRIAIHTDVDLRSPMIIVLDAATTPFSLMGYLKSIRCRSPNCKVLLISDPLVEDEACQLLSLGVRGFLLFCDVEEKLLEAIQAVWQDHLWVSARLLEIFTKRVSSVFASKDRRIHLLTSRENVIAEMLVKRLTNKEIATALGISERTVRFHLSNIFQKIGVHNRYSLADLAASRVIDPFLSEPEDPLGGKKPT